VTCTASVNGVMSATVMLAEIVAEFLNLQ